MRHSCLLCHFTVLSQPQEYISWLCQVRIELRSGQGVLISENEEKSSYRKEKKISLVLKNPELHSDCVYFFSLFPRETSSRRELCTCFIVIFYFLFSQGHSQSFTCFKESYLKAIFVKLCLLDVSCCLLGRTATPFHSALSFNTLSGNFHPRGTHSHCFMHNGTQHLNSTGHLRGTLQTSTNQFFKRHCGKSMLIHIVGLGD